MKKIATSKLVPPTTLALLMLCVACTPTVKVEAPDKPIEINMNINIKHEILIKIEKEVEDMFEDDEGLF